LSGSAKRQIGILGVDILNNVKVARGEMKRQMEKGISTRGKMNGENKKSEWMQGGGGPRAEFVGSNGEWVD
jgi:hypothetical protein